MLIDNAEEFLDRAVQECVIAQREAHLACRKLADSISRKETITEQDKEHMGNALENEMILRAVAEHTIHMSYYMGKTKEELLSLVGSAILSMGDAEAENDARKMTEMNSFSETVN